MITLCTPWPRKKPPPTMCPDVPEPTIVLSEATLISLPTGFIVIAPATTITYGSAAVAYRSSSAWVRTVTIAPPRPPYVPSWPSASTEAKPSAVAVAQAGAADAAGAAAGGTAMGAAAVRCPAGAAVPGAAP
ncbi:hypothetical protein SHIRM173S_10907 [Streptomyces hirsutus]